MSEAEPRLPEDLELIAPGPELAAILDSVDRALLSGRDRLRLAQARNRLASHVQARLLEDLYSVSLDEPPARGAVEPRQASRYRWAETEVAFAMRWTRTAAGGRLEQARELIEDLPAVLHALLAGDIDMPKALVISELVGWLPIEDLALRRELVDRVIDKASRWTTGELRARLRKLVLAIDPAVAAKRYTKAVQTRRVDTLDNPDCTGELWGRNLPPQDTAAAWERLTAIARAAKAAGDNRSMDQLRADAFLDLLVGEGVAVGQPLTHHTACVGGASPQPASRSASLPGMTGAAGSATTAPETSNATDCTTTAPRTSTPTASTTAPRTCTATDSTTAPGTSVATDSATTMPEATTEAPDAWDPAWPIEPWEPIRPHDIYPDPTRTPDDEADINADAVSTEAVSKEGPSTEGPSTEEFAGRQPPQSGGPGRWCDDSAVAAAAGVVRGPLSCGAPCCQAAARRGDSEAGPAGSPMPAPRRGVVELQVPLTTAIGLDDLPGELNGFGPVLGEIARQIIAAMPDAQWRFSAYSRLPELAVHGILATRPVPSLDRRGDRRRPTAEQAAFVRARDRTCRAPGCRRPARGCDLDHTEPWVKGGRTITCNLGCLCRAHHLFRHTTGCDLVQLSPGVFIWRTPRGLQYLTKQDPPLLALPA